MPGPHGGHGGRGVPGPAPASAPRDSPSPSPGGSRRVAGAERERGQAQSSLPCSLGGAALPQPSSSLPRGSAPSLPGSAPSLPAWEGWGNLGKWCQALLIHSPQLPLAQPAWGRGLVADLRVARGAKLVQNRGWCIASPWLFVTGRQNLSSLGAVGAVLGAGGGWAV